MRGNDVCAGIRRIGAGFGGAGPGGVHEGASIGTGTGAGSPTSSARPPGCNTGPMTLAELDLPGGTCTLRKANAADLESVVGLLAADPLRAAVDSMEIEDRHRYERAFQAIDGDPAQLLVVGCTPGNEIVATMQLTLIPGLARAGATRMQVEAVRVRDDFRGGGLGSAMLRWAVAEARRRGAALIQLTSDGSRAAAHRFYERLGFEASHVGFKLSL